MKKISILGSTGSIGTQTLEVINLFPEKFEVIGLSAGENIELLKKQIDEFGPEVVCVKNENYAKKLSKQLNRQKVEIIYGEEGYDHISSLPNTDIVVSAMVGSSGLKPTLSAIKAGKDLALANKESLVVGGEIIIEESKKMGVKIIPVDSEHSAIFQALQGCKKEFVKRVIITASGGPFRNTPKNELENVTQEEALYHPNWKMGNKITIDSATLMNKGFEIIEAKWLFDLPVEKISVWIHPQSILHSMVEYVDGSILSQLSIPDMKIPISYALAYPERLPISNNNIEPVDFSTLTFEEADFDKFEALKLSCCAIEEGGTMAAVLNAANEIAVAAFLKRQIKFTEIINIIKKVMSMHSKQQISSIECIIETDKWARATAESLIPN